MQWNILSPTMIIISRRRMCRQTDTYIAKDSAINEEIDKLRLSATAALVERRDVIVVASRFPVSMVWAARRITLSMMVSSAPGHGEGPG